MLGVMTGVTYWSFVRPFSRTSLKSPRAAKGTTPSKKEPAIITVSDDERERKERTPMFIFHLHFSRV